MSAINTMNEEMSILEIILRYFITSSAKGAWGLGGRKVVFGNIILLCCFLDMLFDYFYD